MPNADDYVTDAELETVRTWDILAKPVGELLDYLESIWWAADWGFKQTRWKNGTIALELHTGGWSGNESVIGALAQNYLFWSLYWERSTRGGHFYFRIAEVQNQKETADRNDKS